MRVLVADDSGALAATAIVFLAWWGHDVEVVHDGIEALRRARAWPADVVLTRARLERMDGLSLLAALRAGGGLAAPAVLLVGSGEDASARARAAQLGAAGFLPTPLVVADLARLLDRLREARAPGAAGRQAPPPRRRSTG